MLTTRNINNVLNAKQHAAGGHRSARRLPGTVTIATNMAGSWYRHQARAGVKEAGGLAIVGTEKHESRQVDRQLRGRSGRQAIRVHRSSTSRWRDDLMRLFGSERISKLMDRSAEGGG